MAPVPKKKTPRGRSNRRRNSPARKRPRVPNLVKCINCKKLRETHKACPNCGYYKETSK